jgi:hypothetical protein
MLCLAYILLYFKFLGCFTALAIRHFFAINPKIKADLTAEKWMSTL